MIETEHAAAEVGADPRRPAVASVAIGVFLVTLMSLVMAGQARGLHGQCRDASWYYVSAVFLPAAIFVSVLFTPIAIYGGCLCRKRCGRTVRTPMILPALAGITLSIGALGGLAYDLYSIRDLLW
jgi:hypothetical protein